MYIVIRVEVENYIQKVMLCLYIFKNCRKKTQTELLIRYKVELKSIRSTTFKSTTWQRREATQKKVSS